MAMLVRVSTDAATVIPMVRRELQALSPAMPFVQVRPYRELVAAQLQPWRLGATMFTLFGAIALIITAIRRPLARGATVVARGCRGPGARRRHRVYRVTRRRGGSGESDQS